MPPLAPNADLRIADLPEDVREEGMRLKTRYHALASDAGLLTEDGAMDLGILGDLTTVKTMDLATLRALAETADKLAALPHAPLSLARFEEVLAKEGLADKLPELKQQLADLAVYNEKTFGFGFTPEDLTIPREDLSRMLLGLKKGILVRPIVIDSPTAEDVERLQLDDGMTLHEYRIRALAASGITFRDMENRIVVWKQLRALRWEDLQNDNNEIDASKAHLASVYPTLPPTDTIATRTGARPRLVLLGPDDEPVENRVLAGTDEQPVVVARTAADRTAEGALKAHARFLPPEATLLVLGLPGVRERKSTKFTRYTWGWLGAVTTDGNVADLFANDDGVCVLANDPSYRLDGVRVLASSE